MRNRDQIPFSLEDLDQQWLPSRRARRAASVTFRLVFGLVFGLVFRLVGGTGFGLVFGLVIGLVGGLFFRTESTRHSDPVDALSIDWSRCLEPWSAGWSSGRSAGWAAGWAAGWTAGLTGGCRGERAKRRERGHVALPRYALRISSAGVVLVAGMTWLFSVLSGGPEDGAMFDAFEADPWTLPALGWAAVYLALLKGGFFFLRHWAVRSQLQRLDLAPRQYVQFLDEAADMLFLRKTGGAYQFFHVTFRDFVAETYGAEWLTKDRRPPESKQTATAN